MLKGSEPTSDGVEIEFGAIPARKHEVPGWAAAAEYLATERRPLDGWPSDWEWADDGAIVVC